MKTLLEELEELKAYCDSNPVTCEEKKCCECNCENRLRYVYEMIENVYRRLAEHEKGHIPTNLSASELKKALKVLGLEDGYEIIPERIYASTGKKLESPTLKICKKEKKD